MRTGKSLTMKKTEIVEKFVIALFLSVGKWGSIRSFEDLHRVHFRIITCRMEQKGIKSCSPLVITGHYGMLTSLLFQTVHASEKSWYRK